MQPIQEFFELQKDLSQFSTKINGILVEKRKAIIDSNQQHSINISNLEIESQHLEQQIKELESKQQKLKDGIDESLHRLNDQQLKVNELNSKQQQLEIQKSQGEQDIKDIEHQISNLSEIILKFRNDLILQNKLDDLEMEKYSRYLGLKLEPLSPHLLRFTFNNIDKHNVDQEFWVEFDLDRIQIINSEPELSVGELQEIQDDFKASQNIKKFLKVIRGLIKTKIENV